VELGVAAFGMAGEPNAVVEELPNEEAGTVVEEVVYVDLNPSGIAPSPPTPPTPTISAAKPPNVDAVPPIEEPVSAGFGGCEKTLNPPASLPLVPGVAELPNEVPLKMPDVIVRVQ
jgi:hypothetical protein